MSIIKEIFGIWRPYAENISILARYNTLLGNLKALFIFPFRQLGIRLAVILNFFIMYI